MSITFADLREALGKWLRQQQDEEGFKPPLHLVAVGRSGSMSFCRYVDDGNGALEAEDLASHVEGQGFDLPVNVMLTDCTGRSAYLAFDPESD